MVPVHSKVLVCSRPSRKRWILCNSNFCSLWKAWDIMTSSNGNIFCVAGHVWPVTGEMPAQRPVTRSFDVVFDLRLINSKQWWGWWFETPSRPLWLHFNDSSWNVKRPCLCYSAWGFYLVSIMNFELHAKWEYYVVVFLLCMIASIYS